MAQDPSFDLKHPSLDSPANIMFAITPGPADLPFRTRGLYVGTGGTLVVVDTIGTQVTLTNVPNGTILPLRVDKVLATGTASGLIGLY